METVPTFLNMSINAENLINKIAFFNEDKMYDFSMKKWHVIYLINKWLIKCKKLRSQIPPYFKYTPTSVARVSIKYYIFYTYPLFIILSGFILVVALLQEAQNYYW